MVLFYFCSWGEIRLFRRLLTVLLVLCLLTAPALADEVDDYLSSCDILSQLDDRFNNNDYAYARHHFWENGCLPASITNALAAAFDASEVSVPALLKEVMTLLAPNHRPVDKAIDVKRLSYLYEGSRDSAYPTLNRLLDNVSSISCVDSKLSAQELLEQLTAQDDSRVALMFNITIRKNWERILDITDALYNAGYHDARLVIYNITVGTPGTIAPFRSAGAAGHYASLFFSVREFYESGTFYLLDSYPRALEGETYGKGELYPAKYAFVHTSARAFESFNTMYRVTHVTPTVVKVTLLPDSCKALNALADDPALTPEELAAARREMRLNQLTPCMFYGTGTAFLVLP